MPVTSTVSTSAANLTKYYAGGSGDNIIADGYIKTVEKIWIDSYTIAFTNTLTCIQIAELPENKKVTSIVVDLITTITQSGGTISLGYVQDTTDILATAGVGDFMAPTTITNNLTKNSIVLPGGSMPGGTATSGTVVFAVVNSGFQNVTAGTNTTIGIKLNNWDMTTGTLKTIVRYT